MANAPDSRLFRSELKPRTNDAHEKARDRLRVGLAELRERGDVLARRIEIDLPEFTEHDGQHLDALWPLVDLVSPSDLALSPLEVFLLGGAIVIHDLGLPIAAYPGGRDELRRLARWRDSFAMRRKSSAPGASDGEVASETDAEVLRVLHAQRAILLPTQGWVDQQGATHFLIENQQLREDLGHLMGTIAASHWEAASELPSLLPSGVRPAGFPRSWDVRPVLLACLLRVADAAHLDGNRAPKWTRVHRHLGKIASAHWDFQDRLGQPELRGDSLRFGALRPFEPEQAFAWWTCLDALTVLDTELHAVDRVLVEEGLPRLAARSVMGIESPGRLARFVQCRGWEPVDARIQVTDVARLVRTLGGEALYGNERWVPLRELIANARDATVARAAVAGTPLAPIVVTAWDAGDATYLQVDDAGVGMDPNVLTGALLDFGRGLWDARELVDVHPGLAETDYEAVGRYGIGFFSTFMWAEVVKVISRPFRKGEEATRVLVIDGGPGARPLLRMPAAAEQRTVGGTSVVLEMRQTPFGVSRAATERNRERHARLASRQSRTHGLWGAIAEIAPAVDVDVAVAAEEGIELVIAANDWITLEPDELLRRIMRSDRESFAPISEAMMVVRSETGKALARSALIPGANSFNGPPGVACVGGLAAHPLYDVAGIWMSEPTTAARTSSHPLASDEEIARWAECQAAYWSERVDDETQLALAANVIRLGGDPGPLATYRSADGPITSTGFREWLAAREEVTVIDFMPRANFFGQFPEPSELPPNTILEPHQPILSDQLHWLGAGAVMMDWWVADRIAKIWNIPRDQLKGKRSTLDLQVDDSPPQHHGWTFRRPT